MCYERRPKCGRQLQKAPILITLTIGNLNTKKTAHASSGNQTFEIERSFCPFGYGGTNMQMHAATAQPHRTSAWMAVWYVSSIASAFRSAMRHDPDRRRSRDTSALNVRGSVKQDHPPARRPEAHMKTLRSIIYSSGNVLKFSLVSCVGPPILKTLPRIVRIARETAAVVR